jgi:hypothetical protein
MRGERLVRPWICVHKTAVFDINMKATSGVENDHRLRLIFPNEIHYAAMCQDKELTLVSLSN